MSALMLWTCVLVAADAFEPSPLPSGLELLYSDRIPISASGEPMVAVGLMAGESALVFETATTSQLDFYEGDALQQAHLPAGARLELKLVKGTAAKRAWYVDVDGTAADSRARFDELLASWRGRGLKDAQALEEGTLLGLGGRVVDNRAMRITVPVPSRSRGEAVATELYQRFGVRAFVAARLTDLPSAEIDVKLNGAPLGTALSYVRLTPLNGGEAAVRDVRFGKGYSWEGRERRTYRGELYAVVDADGKLAAVNVLGAERVLQGVVPSEMFATAPAEALKAQAVAARNQLVAKLGHRHHDDPFHLCSEQHCQVYGGLRHEDARANRAVQATAGEVAFRAGRLVDTVYSSTCGGHSEDNDAVWGNAADPALRGRPDFDVVTTGNADDDEHFARALSGEVLEDWLRTPPRTYCSSATQAKASKFRWTQALAGAELASLVRTKQPSIGRLRELRVLERGPGGRVMSLELEGDAGRATLLMELPIRRFFGNLNSGAFTLTTEKDAAGYVTAATFRGAGWGHGVGMCQTGAMGRAEAGHDYQAILNHYYNGARAERLYRATALPEATGRLAGRTE